MKIVSWNILQGGGKRALAISDVISAWAADMVILQEFRHGSSSRVLTDALSELGLNHQYFDAQESGKNCVLVASNTQIQCAPWSNNLSATRALHVRTKSQELDIELMAAHLPQKRAQVPFFEALLDNYQNLLSRSALIVGDLNCGIPFEDSDTQTFANTHLFQALLQQGWIDSWRTRNANAKEYTWISNKGNGYRYDHCLSTKRLDKQLKSVEYDHEVRESGLSDHSALVLELK